MRIAIVGFLGLVVGGVAGVALSERIKNAIWLLVMRLNQPKAPK